MKTEQDIRIFMQANRIPVPKDDAFMTDLIRQINLLPTPAGLSEKDDRIQEGIRMMKAVFDALAKRRRRQSVIAALVSIAFCAVIFIAGYVFQFPGIQNPLTITILASGLTVLAVRCTGLVRTW